MLLTGDPAAGKSYFEGAGGCSGCHSPTGDLKGIAAKYDAVTLELRLISPITDRRRATVTLPSGQKLQGQLLSLDTFDVSIVGDDGSHHTWPLTAVRVDVNDPLATHWELISKYSNSVIHNLLAYLETLK
jgi:cytochrome c oxidase cbb3-type subunit 3